MKLLKHINFICPKCGEESQNSVPASALKWWMHCDSCDYEVVCGIEGEGYELPVKDRILNVRLILGEGKFIPNWETAAEWGDEADVIWYQGDFYIDVWADEYHLILESSEYTSQCLSDLEYLLAEYKLMCVGGKYKDLF